MKRLEDTHGTLFELVRHLLLRMFDSELFSAPGQWRTVAVGAIAALLPAAPLLLAPSYSGKYFRLSLLPSPEPFRAAALADQLSLMTLVFAVAGLLALLEWQSLFPGRRDYLALAGLPVRSRQIFIARFTAMFLFSSVIIIAMNTLPALLVPATISGRWEINPSLAAKMAAHAAAFFMASYFALFAVVALQGAMLNLLPGRVFARAATYVQAALMGALFLLLLLSQPIANWEGDTIARARQFGVWAPPVWFWGLEQHMLGGGHPFFAEMARRAFLASAAAAVLAVGLYLVSYGRHRKLLIEAPAGARTAGGRERSLLRLLARGPRDGAVLDFLSKTLARSRFHRLVVLCYAGVALALPLNSLLAVASQYGRWREAIQSVVLTAPLAATIVVLCGLRHVFSMPSELGANWLFRLTETQGRQEWMRAVERFVLACGIAPIYLLIAPLTFAVMGWKLAAQATLMQVVLSLAIFETLFQSWEKLPFTCAYRPGKRSLLAVIAGYISALFAFVPIVAIIIALSSRKLVPYLLFLAIFAAAWLRLRASRRDGWGEGRLLYDDVLEVVPDLGLGRG